MSVAFVLDCSVTMVWCFDVEATPATRKLRQSLESQAALVPPHWVLEVVNALKRGEKTRKTTESRADEFVLALRSLDIQIDNAPSDSPFSTLLPLCRAHDLTSYDAAYLELALRRKLPLATLDNQLRAAAKKVGVKLLGK